MRRNLFEPGQGREAAALRSGFRAPRGRLARAGIWHSAWRPYFEGRVRDRFFVCEPMRRAPRLDRGALSFWLCSFTGRRRRNLDAFSYSVQNAWPDPAAAGRDHGVVAAMGLWRLRARKSRFLGDSRIDGRVLWPGRRVVLDQSKMQRGSASQGRHRDRRPGVDRLRDSGRFAVLAFRRARAGGCAFRIDLRIHHHRRHGICKNRRLAALHSVLAVFYALAGRHGHSGAVHRRAAVSGSRRQADV
ncbi:MAG: hypothetical protein BWZ10_00759 [candidate division BRC1 bacterium ADurb.BinA364]|nr:MAG: hypothetical protein BWZ10_00759 [candidate division BRC1 bacterium ADurb.BinA364]